MVDMVSGSGGGDMVGVGGGMVGRLDGHILGGVGVGWDGDWMDGCVWGMVGESGGGAWWLWVGAW